MITGNIWSGLYVRSPRGADLSAAVSNAAHHGCFFILCCAAGTRLSVPAAPCLSLKRNHSDRLLRLRKATFLWGYSVDLSRSTLWRPTTFPPCSTSISLRSHTVSGCRALGGCDLPARHSPPSAHTAWCVIVIVGCISGKFNFLAHEAHIMAVRSYYFCRRRAHYRGASAAYQKVRCTALRTSGRGVAALEASCGGPETQGPYAPSNFSLMVQVTCIAVGTFLICTLLAKAMSTTPLMLFMNEYNENCQWAASMVRPADLSFDIRVLLLRGWDLPKILGGLHA